MIRMTPPIGTRGRYTLKSPWSISLDEIYECIAVRSFGDMELRGIDVLNDIFVPNALGTTDYNKAKAAESYIITLQSDEGSYVYVPDVYIESYPNMGDVKYQHTVLSVSLGAIPDYISLDLLKVQIASDCSDITGVEGTVYENIVPTSEAVDPEDHEVFEVNRAKAIKERQSDYANLLAKEKAYDDLLERYKTLEQMVIDNGLV